LTQAYTANNFPYNGSLIFSEASLQNPQPTDPLCEPSGKTAPLGTLAWAPLAGEGVVAEGSNLLDVTSGCGTVTSRHPGMSVFGLGFAVNTSATGGLVNFASGKYGTLTSTITGEIGEGVLAAAIPPSPQLPNGNFTYQLQQCIATSQGAFTAGASFYNGAAVELLTADQDIAAVATTDFTANPEYPNPSGSLRSRLQNMYYTINTRLLLNQSGTGPPSPPPAPPSPAITGTPPKGSTGTFYTFTPSAHDFAHQTATPNLSFSATGLPSWAAFDNTTGTLSGTPTKGTFTGIVITVTDGCASAPLGPLTIKVTG